MSYFHATAGEYPTKLLNNTIYLCNVHVYRESYQKSLFNSLRQNQRLIVSTADECQGNASSVINDTLSYSLQHNTTELRSLEIRDIDHRGRKTITLKDDYSEFLHTPETTCFTTNPTTVHTHISVTLT